MYPHSLPVGTPYPSKYHGATVLTRYISTLTYRWGPVAKPYYIIPILSGLVSEWVPAENIHPQLLAWLNQVEKESISDAYAPRNSTIPS